MWRLNVIILNNYKYIYIHLEVVYRFFDFCVVCYWEGRPEYLVVILLFPFGESYNNELNSTNCFCVVKCKFYYDFMVPKRKHKNLFYMGYIHNNTRLDVMFIKILIYNLLLINDILIFIEKWRRVFLKIIITKSFILKWLIKDLFYTKSIYL